MPDEESVWSGAWWVLLLAPVVETAGAWLVLKAPLGEAGYGPAGIFLAACTVASVVVCALSAKFLSAHRFALLMSIAAPITLFGLAPLVFYAYAIVTAGSASTAIFLGPFALLFGAFLAGYMWPLLVFLPVMGLVWGVSCAFALCRDGRISAVAAFVCGLLLFVPAVGLVALVVMLVMGWRKRVA